MNIEGMKFVAALGEFASSLLTDKDNYKKLSLIELIIETKMIATNFCCNLTESNYEYENLPVIDSGEKVIFQLTRCAQSLFFMPNNQQTTITRIYALERKAAELLGLDFERIKKEYKK